RHQRDGRGATDAAAPAIRPKHLQIQARHSLRAARADGHRADQRCDPRPRPRAGADCPDRGRRQRRADDHRRGNSGGDAMPATLRRLALVPGVPTRTQDPAGAPLDPFVYPGPTNAPTVFEPTAGLTAGAVEVWIIASGGVDWGGCQIWVSTDGNTYALAGTI